MSIPKSDATEVKVLIAIPCYNCENQISRVLMELDRVFVGNDQIKGIVVIDNRSVDNTVLAAKNALNLMQKSEQVKIYVNEKNYGLGGSHKVAFQLCQDFGCNYLAVVHGDNQADPNDLAGMIRTAIEKRNCAILGSRFMSSSQLRNYSIIRTLGNKILNRLYSLLTLRKITDLGSGLNLFFMDEKIMRILGKCDDGFTFNMDLLLGMIKNRLCYLFFPIKWKTEDEISNAKTLQVGLRTALKILSWRFGILNNPYTPLDSYKTRQVL